MDDKPALEDALLLGEKKSKNLGRRVDPERRSYSAAPPLCIDGSFSLCENWRDFSWRRHKPRVLNLCGSLTVLLAAALLVNSSSKEKFFLLANLSVVESLLWVLCLVLAVFLLRCLCCDYDRSRIVCESLFPIVILFAFAAWYVPKLVCIARETSSPSSSSSSSSSSLDCNLVDPLIVVLASSLPLLVLCAPVMSFQVASGLAALILLFVFALATNFSCSWIGLATEGVWVLSPLVYVSSVVASYQGWRSEKEVFAFVASLKKVLSCSSRENRESREELDAVRRDSSERIAKMRQFISYIFHEIRVPFNAVVLGIGHLLATNVSDEQQEVLNMMDSSSSSMIRILNDVLDMGKIESGKLQLEKQPFNLAELVSSLIWAFKDTLESKGLEFSLSVDDCTKEFLSTHDLVGDKHRIRQVLANYLSNATKFTPRGGRVKLHVVWNNRLNEDEQEIPKRDVACVTVSVEDTGIGISKEDQLRLFEPYMQVHAGSAQSHGGTGLGLSFAKRIVELSGGKIGVFSDTGKGSVFFFTVPFEVAGAVSKDAEDVFVNPFDLPAETRAESGSGVSAGGGGGVSSSGGTGNSIPKVLIVEDNQVNRRILRKLLASFNIESDTAEDGQQAVEMCRGGTQYDMILIDKEMPVMDGHEATREIRAMGVKTTIVGLTGNALDSDRNQFMAAGVNDFFTKPLSRHQLLRLLEAHGLLIHNK